MWVRWKFVNGSPRFHFMIYVSRTYKMVDKWEVAWPKQYYFQPFKLFHLECGWPGSELSDIPNDRWMMR